MQRKLKRQFFARDMNVNCHVKNTLIKRLFLNCFFILAHIANDTFL